MPDAERPERAPRIDVAAPNRVDLAGGTLDIFPVYLLVPGSMTVNAAIGVTSVVSIRPVRRGARLVSDRGVRSVSARDTHSFPTGGPFGLVAAALRRFPPRTGVELRFRNEAPVGSGLGASSALLVATMMAMARCLGKRVGWRETAREATEVEAAHLHALTGSQDHIAALRGGIQGIRYEPGRVEAARIAPGTPRGRALEAHGFLAATGRSHFSAGVNWRMVRRALDGDPGVLRKFRGIAGTARDAWDALSAGEIDRVGRALGREWAIRRTIAPGVSTRAVDELFSTAAFRRRVLGAKLCGAAGGGMVFGLLRDPDMRAPLESLLRRSGFVPRPFLLSRGPRIRAAGEEGDVR